MADPAPPRPKPRRARGLMDRRGPGLAVERELIARIAKVYEDWGFEPLETPAFEYADALGKFLPDQDRPNEGVFAFEDDEEWVALRYDLTAPLARFVAENFDALPKPYRRWAAGPVWRNEKPGPGRYREFWQCDADTVGSASPAADAELIAMACAALEAAGVGKLVIKVNSRLLLDGVLEVAQVGATRLTVLRAIDKMDRLGVSGVRDLLTTGRRDESGDLTSGAGLSPTQAEYIIRFVTAPASLPSAELITGLWAYVAPDLTLVPDSPGDRGIVEVSSIFNALQTFNLGDRVQFDPGIVRGLEYYTGAVFEAQLLTPGGAAFGSVGGGGRYDDLVARFRGERIPATGFSIGVSRLAAALEAQGAAEQDGPVVVLVMDQARVGDALAMAGELRAAGVRAEAYLGAGGMKAQLKYADKRSAPVAVIQGGDELAKGVVTLKDLKLGAKIASGLGEDREAYAKAREQVQLEVPRGQLVAAVQQMLAK
ncbi:MAG: histidine--tRNA ligase [Vitreimonas sp.]